LLAILTKQTKYITNKIFEYELTLGITRCMSWRSQNHPATCLGRAWQMMQLPLTAQRSHLYKTHNLTKLDHVFLFLLHHPCLLLKN